MNKGNFCPSADMVIDHTEKLSNLETMTALHGRALETLSSSVETMTTQFTQVKWALYGAVGLYVVDKLGIIGAIELLIGG